MRCLDEKQREVEMEKITNCYQAEIDRIKFGEGTKTEPKPSRPLSPAPKPHEVTAPPPSLPGAIKDEVELLRAGNVNKHGERLKPGSVEKWMAVGPP